MFRLILLPLAFLICPPPGTVSHRDAILNVWICLAGFVFSKLLVMHNPEHITRIFMLSLLFLLVVGFLTMIGGFGVGSWRLVMSLSCLLIFALWMARSLLSKRFLSMLLKILIFPVRLGFLSFRSCIKLFLMSVAFALLAVGVMLGVRWVL